MRWSRVDTYFGKAGAALWAAGKRPIFLFAHADDLAMCGSVAAFGVAGGGLDLLLCSAVPVDASSPGSWDTECGLGLPAAAMSVRLQEHNMACETLGMTTVCLGGIDRQYGAGAPWDGKKGELFASARAAAEVWRADSVISHQRHSYHPDHQAAHILARHVAQALEIPLITTCDRPYVRCEDGVCARGPRPVGGSTWVLSEEEWARKLELLTCYTSQIGALRAAFGTDFISQALLGVECYYLEGRCDREF